MEDIWIVWNSQNHSWIIHKLKVITQKRYIYGYWYTITAFWLDQCQDLLSG